MNKYNHYTQNNAEYINDAIAGLPIAESLNLFAAPKGTDLISLPETAEAVPRFQAIKVTMIDGKTHIVNCPRRRYSLVQHGDAFRPIIEGLTLAGVQNFDFGITSSPRKAEMHIYTLGEGFDTVKLGFNVQNSFDGSSTIRYGFRMLKGIIELVGYRVICSNGMKVRVPLENADIILPEERGQIENLWKQSTSIRHTRSANGKIKALQYVVEAMAILKNPAERLFAKAKQFTFTDIEQYETLIKAHVGERYKSRVLRQFSTEEDRSLWSLYNAVTFVASHTEGLNETSRDRLLDGAADLLLVAAKV